MHAHEQADDALRDESSGEAGSGEPCDAREGVCPIGPSDTRSSAQASAGPEGSLDPARSSGASMRQAARILAAAAVRKAASDLTDGTSRPDNGAT